MKDNSSKRKVIQPPQVPTLEQQATLKIANTEGYQTPTEFVSLPSKGRYYPEGHPWRNIENVEIKFMTAREEDILVSLSYREKGETLNKFMESLIISPKVDVRTIQEGDQNALMLAARISAFGVDAEVRSICSTCQSMTIVDLNLSEFFHRDCEKLIQDKAVTYDDENNEFKCTLPKSKSEVVFELLTKEKSKRIVDSIRKKRENNLQENIVSESLREAIVSIDGNSNIPQVAKLVENMSAYDTGYLVKMLRMLKPDIETTFNYTCTSCNSREKKSLELDASFLLPDIKFF